MTGTGTILDNDVDANDDNVEGIQGQAVTIDVLANDGNDLNTSSVRIMDVDGNPVVSLLVDGEGIWVVNADGMITFTPETGFTGDPTPVQYIVKDNVGNTSQPASINIDYPQVIEANDDEVNAQRGEAITINVLQNDTSDNEIDLTSVSIIDPNSNEAVTELLVNGEGNWTVNIDGTITFVPEDGFIGDPTPIQYTVKDIVGNVSEPATVIVDYPQTATDANDDNVTGKVGIPTIISILENDIDNEDDTNKSNVNLIIPNDIKNGIDTDTDGDGDIDKIVVPGEGIWNVDDDGVVTFTPEDGFTGDPTPITYTVGDNTGAISDLATINIDILQELQDDHVIGIIHQTRVINILDNDDAVNSSTVNLMGSSDTTGSDTDGDGDIDQIIVPGEGIWSVDNNGVLTFTPEPNFIESPTPIRYTAKDENGNLSEPASVSIEYSAGALLVPTAVDDGLTIHVERVHTRDVSDNDIPGEGGKDGQKYNLLNPTTGEKIAVGNTVKLDYGVIRMEENGIYAYTPYANAVGVDKIEYIMEDIAGQDARANIVIDVDCASSQTSDSAGSLETIGMLLWIFILGLTGIYYIRKEEVTI